MHYRIRRISNDKYVFIRFVGWFLPNVCSLGKLQQRTFVPNDVSHRKRHSRRGPADIHMYEWSHWNIHNDDLFVQHLDRFLSGMLIKETNKIQI